MNHVGNPESLKAMADSDSIPTKHIKRKSYMCSLHRVAALKRRASFSGMTRSELLPPQRSGGPGPEKETTLSLQQQLPSLSVTPEMLSLKPVIRRYTYNFFMAITSDIYPIYLKTVSQQLD